MILFGPSGNSEGFFAAGLKNSEQSAVWVKNMGLDAFEYSFGRGVLMSEEKALSIGKAFNENNVKISVHAPYYINFSNPDPEMIDKSIGYVIKSAEMVGLMGGNRIIIHPATQGKDTRENAFARALDNFKKLTDVIYATGMDNLVYCPETMGKYAQLGTVEEITEICKIDKIYVPTVDFGHVNSREGGSLKSKEDFIKRLQFMIDELGYDRMKHFHVHFSKIQYGAKGEIRHLNFDDEVYGPEFEPLADALIDLKLEPVIICESAGMQDVDALYMKNYYFSQLNK
ncbi:MAG: endonuclease IV [Clostridiales bacterium]|nr:endonuclease IV [Clostridiales bacterium]